MIEQGSGQGQDPQRLGDLIRRRDQVVPILQPTLYGKLEVDVEKNIREGALKNTIDELRRITNPYAATLHATYADRLEKPSELIKNVNKGIQFTAGEINEEGKIAVVSMIPQNLQRPDEADRRKFTFRKPKPIVGCKSVVIAQVPYKSLPDYSSTFLSVRFGGRIPEFSGLPQDFYGRTDYAAGFYFDKHGRISDIAFRGTLATADASVRHVNPLYIALRDKGFDVHESEPFWRRRGYELTKEGRYIPKSDGSNAKGLALPIDDEVALILHKLPFELH